MAHIVVVEDEPHIRNMFSIALRHRAHRVTEVADGREAIEALEADGADLVLLDLCLPQVDGFEVARAVRQSSDTQLRRIPVIAVTARAEREVQAKAKAAGCDDTFTKPLSVRALADHVEQVLASRARKTPASA